MFPAGKRAQHLSLVKHSEKNKSSSSSSSSSSSHLCIHTERGWEDLELCHTCSVSLGLSFIFADGGEWSVTKLVIFCAS